MTLSFANELARHCAPVLMGAKPASLFTTSFSLQEIEQWAMTLRQQCVEIKVFSKKQRRPLVMVYRPTLVHTALRHHLSIFTLTNLGYPIGGSLNDMMSFLDTRLTCLNAFPHEIGFFLGYPPHYVVGFIRHAGAECKYCGIWKVYDDVDNAVSLAQQYDAAKKCRNTSVVVETSGNCVKKVNRRGDIRWHIRRSMNGQNCSGILEWHRQKRSDGERHCRRNKSGRPRS